jgi:cytochrome c553/nitrate/TMAO reductase-like tetraheme cytochrome c subunit
MTKKQKIIIAVALGITGLILTAGKVGVLPVYGVASVFQSPDTCSACHETWYNEAIYAFNPKGNAKPPSSGVTIGCAECHPVQYEEYRLSAMGSSKNALRPGCTNCHDKSHSVFQWFTHMYRGTKVWTQMVQLALRDRDLYNTELGPHLAPKARARFIETDSARCRECHRQNNQSLLKGTLGVYRPEIPPHQEAKGQKLTCIQCHQNLTHNLSFPVAWRGKPNGAVPGNFEAGKKKSATCVGCHGSDGNSAQSTFPHIAGLNANYLLLQLQAFRTGRRKNDIMQGIVVALSEQDIADLAVYFSKQKMRPTRFWPKVLSLQLRADLEIGASLYQQHCARCHGLTGRGQGIFPAVAGQYPDYAVAQMAAFKAASRNQHSIMRDVAKGLSDNDLRLIADYLAGLK